MSGVFEGQPTLRHEGKTRGGSIPAEWRIERAEKILEALRDFRDADARKLMAAPEPIHKDRPLLGQQKYVHETPKPPEPPRVDVRAAIEARTQRTEPVGVQEVPLKALAPEPQKVEAPPGEQPLVKLRRLLQAAADECENEAAKWPSAFRGPWHKLRDELLEKLVGLE